MLGTPYQIKLTFLANLLTFLRILLQWKLDYDIEVGSACDDLDYRCSKRFPSRAFRVIKKDLGLALLLES